MINIDLIEEKVKFDKEKLMEILNIAKGSFDMDIKDKIDVILCIFCK